MEFEKIQIAAAIKVPIATVWHLYTAPEHVVKWNAASADWHTTKATADLRVGGIFSSRMEAKDGSFGFDFYGTYTAVEPLKHLAYTLGDDRKVSIDFSFANGITTIEMVFEAETENSLELQKTGWQAILDNFKKYCETSNA